MVFLVRQSLLTFFNHLPVLTRNVIEIGLSRNYARTSDHVSCLKSFCCLPWISWKKQSISESQHKHYPTKPGVSIIAEELGRFGELRFVDINI